MMQKELTPLSLEMLSVGLQELPPQRTSTSLHYQNQMNSLLHILSQYIDATTGPHCILSLTCLTHQRFTEDALDILHQQPYLQTAVLLPISTEDTLQPSTGTCTTSLATCIELQTVLLLIDIPIQDRACQITVLPGLHTGNSLRKLPSACYDINIRYFWSDQ